MVINTNCCTVAILLQLLSPHSLSHWKYVALFVAQSFLNYALLCVVFSASHAFRMARNPDCCTVKKQHILVYVLASLVDVEANYLIVKAYQYTTVTSVQV